MPAPPSPPRALVLLGGAAATVVVAAGLHAAAWVVAPAFMALVVVITIDPVRRRLCELGLPGWAATTVLILLVLGGMVALAGLALVAVAQLATILPAYAAEADAVVGAGAARRWASGVWGPSSCGRWPRR